MSGKKFDRAVLVSFKKFMDVVAATVTDNGDAKATPLGQLVTDHLGSDATTLPVVSETIADHRLVDADIALDNIAGTAGQIVHGVSGGQQRFHSTMSEMLANPFMAYRPAPVDYTARPTGPDTSRQVVAFGLRLLTFHNEPVAVIQRAANQQFGRNEAELEVMAATTETVTAFLAELRRLMIEHSVLRGQVLSFAGSQFGASAGVTFLPRPDISAEQIILPDGVLKSVVDHVIGIGEKRDDLLAAGQHLKRGVLLFGPPGTGKTLTVKHLLTRTPDITTVLLTGSSIAYIGAAAEIARTFQPSIVVMEDIDLVAMQRSSTPQPLLFEVLDALDGLDGDADVAFVMTTNRVQVLERALAERPGRVDLAVEIDLPGSAERRRLFHRYAAGLPFSQQALDDAAARSDGVTGSFAKELIRRSVLAAALRGEPATDTDLNNALEDLLSTRESLTRRLLGAGGPDAERWNPETELDDEPSPAQFLQPLNGMPAMNSTISIHTDDNGTHINAPEEDSP
ncbi:AAA family ATPase [Subtercola boreus]|uniref:AAA family ATPase n=1 Tax=Subtercola boreus TaxID=120213 RepID=A0A3E0VYF7_9MICO|nr:ATP-binding protein [Subtercola boreus]RFA13857.1 AAA family ATPase [Subtercola boreus]